MLLMSKITNLIFKGEPHYITQEFSKEHNGTDYGTYRKKIPQYAIENGTITFVGIDPYGSKYIKIYYPRIKKTFLQGHLDTIYVKLNDSVNSNTKLGLTGMTGNATGIHLHLSIIDNENRCYIDPEEYANNYIESTNTASPEEDVTYIVQPGDNLSKIALKYHTKWQKIYDDNKDTIGNNPDLIYPNQSLIIK